LDVMRQQLKTFACSLLACSILFFCLLPLVAAASGNGGGSDRHLWKSVPRAQCKIDDKTPLAWNIFQTGQKKETHLVLVLLGRRYIALDIKAKVAYTVLLSDLQPKGGDLESGDLFVQSRILPTDGWSVRDVGPAELIRLKLNDYGTMLQIELPHAPDLRAFY
jgi:hypothetical protein